MKSWKMTALLALSGVMSAGAWAQAPADAPAGSTGLCKDGSYTSNATKKGACAGHKGVRTWYAAASASAAAPATAAAPAAPATPAPAAAPAAKPAVAATAKPAAATTAAAPVAGDVWVNTPTKVYHCPGSKWYGKTKEGAYMSEAAAKAAGNHADHGKACS